MALTAALAAGSGMAAELLGLTTRQMEALPLRDVDKIVKKDFLSVLQPVRRLSQGTRPFLHNIDQTTSAFGTGYNGLCRRDVVRLRYATIGDKDPFPQRKLEPYSVEAKAQFAVRGALPVVGTLRTYPEERVWQADCARLSDDTSVAWFYAPDDREAAVALNLLDGARSRVKAGTLQARGVMRGSGIEPKDIDRIEPCKAEPNTVCYRYVLREAGLVTLVARDEHIYAQVSPDDVVSVNDGEVLIDDNPDGWP